MHGACSRSLVVPSVGGLVTGQFYYSRVFAYNRVGYGSPATTLSPEKPMVVPGRPTGVALEVYGATALKGGLPPPPRTTAGTPWTRIWWSTPLTRRFWWGSGTRAW